MVFAAVLRAAREGQGAAFRRLYEAMVDPVVGFVRGRGVGDVDAVVNEVFLAVFRNLDGFEGNEAGFRSWVFRIARHKVADWFRVEGRHLRRVEAAAQSREIGAGFGGAEVDEVIGEVELQRLLATLTPDQRDVVLLKVVADLTVREAAAALGKPETAVKALLRRAMGRLRAEIGEIREPAVSK